MELTITSEKIKKASETSKEAKNALIKLFPEVFQDAKYVNLQIFGVPLMDTTKMVEAGFPFGDPIRVNKYGEYKNKSFELTNSMNWQLLEEDGKLILLPVKKD